MLAHLFSAMRVEMSPSFTENVPPKPQHFSHSAISATFAPAFCSRARGCALMPSSRSPEQLS
jgi:hypothetical protein